MKASRRRGTKMGRLWRLVVVVTAFTVWVLTSTGPSLAAVVRIRGQANVSNSIVRLADIAEIAGTAEEMEGLGRIEIGPAPGIDRTRRLDFASIRNTLRAKWGDLADVTFTGRSTVLVRRLGTRPAETRPIRRLATSEPQKATPSRRDPAPARMRTSEKQAAQQLLMNILLKQTGMPEEVAERYDIDVSYKGVDAARLLRAEGPFRLQIPKLRENRPLAGVVRYYASDGAISECPVTYTFRRRPLVVAVRHTIRRGEIVGPDDVLLVPVDRAGGSIMRVDDIVGREATRTLQANAPVKRSDIRETPLVRPNDIVTVKSQIGTIVVSRPFRSRGTGGKGESVIFVTLDGKEKVSAIVTGYRQASISPPVASEAPVVGSEIARRPSSRTATARR